MGRVRRRAAVRRYRPARPPLVIVSQSDQGELLETARIDNGPVVRAL